MKSVFSKITLIIAVGAAMLTASCSKEVPETYVAVKMAGIELKSSPDAKSETIAPASMGEIFRFTEFPAD